MLNIENSLGTWNDLFGTVCWLCGESVFVEKLSISVLSLRKISEIIRD